MPYIYAAILGLEEMTSSELKPIRSKIQLFCECALPHVTAKRKKSTILCKHGSQETRPARASKCNNGRENAFPTHASLQAEPLGYNKCLRTRIPELTLNSPLPTRVAKGPVSKEFDSRNCSL